MKREYLNAERPMIHLATKIESLPRSPEAHGAENDAAATERPHKLLNLERPTAELLYMLVTGGRRRRILEIGTSNRYTAIWPALATGRKPRDPFVPLHPPPPNAPPPPHNPPP